MSSTGYTPSSPVPLHLYVHVPVCRTRCPYCDFFSAVPAQLEIAPAELAERLVAQAWGWVDRGLGVRPLRTLYVGGGTPTMLGVALPGLVGGIAERFGLEERAEVTVEANPDSIDRGLVESLAEVGVTRVSLGVQSLDDGELVLLGRPHNASRALDAAGDVCDGGLSLSVDLMCGLPGQDLATWERTLEMAIATGADHVSVYPLSLEPGTPLQAAVLAGEVPEPDEDVAARAMGMASEMLGRAGLERYEIANHARPGYRSRHNTAYWTGAEYLGVGPSAHGMLGRDAALAAGTIDQTAPFSRLRYAVPADLGRGLTPVPQLEIELLDEAEAAREDAMLGLRLAEGITDLLARDADVTGVLEDLGRRGLVTHGDGRWRITGQGWLMGNVVFGAVWNAGTV